MRKLAKYIKPYRFSFILALVLLFGQAMGELNLPNLMANIVNIGLQQSGIEHAAPEAISPRSLDFITAYMPLESLRPVTAHYTPISSGSSTPQGPAAHLLYPNMEDTVYVRLPVSPDEQKELDEIFSSAAAAMMGTDMFTGQAGIIFARACYEELGVDVGAIQTRYIVRTGLYMLLIALLAGAATISVGYLAPRIASGAARDLRRDIFAKVEGFSHHEFDKLSSASLITRCTNDVGQVQMLVGMGLRMLCFAPIMAIGGIIMAVNKSVSMSWTIALVVVILIGLAVSIIRVAMPKFKIIQQLVDRLNKVSREILNGLMVIRAFNTQKHEVERFGQANRELMDVNLFVWRVMAIVGPAMTFVMGGASLLIIWVGAGQIAESHMQIGDMMAFMQYVMQVIIAFMMISMMLVFVPRAAVSAERINEVLDTPLSITDPENPLPFDENKSGVVEFNGVSFRHHEAEENALTDISFTAFPGQTLAIIGATGSGKSTLANLLLRFYDVSQGSIMVSGADIRQVRQADLRAKIGYVPQKGQLLKGTVAANIGYGNDPALSEQEITEAAEAAQGLDFITAMESGFDSEISQGGANVSGGQKQRLAIARALAKKPEILVFDDSFSALDFQTDARLRKALKEYTSPGPTGGGCQPTVIVIAQRVGTIMNAEQILVLDEGNIVGRGTHAELLTSCPAYAEIASSQLVAAKGAEADV